MGALRLLGGAPGRTLGGWPLLVVFVGALVLAGSVSAQVTAEDFTAELADIERVLDAGKWAQGKQELIALLDQHGDAEHVLLRANEVQHALKRCQFWMAYDEPEPEDLMSGELLSYDKRGGKIKVRYTREVVDEDPVDGENPVVRALAELLGLIGGSSALGGDFELSGGVPLHPIHFAGPYTVEIKGHMPEGDDRMGVMLASPRMVVRMDDGDFYDIEFGYPLNKGTGYYIDPLINVVEAGRPRNLETASKTSLKLGKPYTLKLNVSARKITASVNGRTLVSAKKEHDGFGQFGFSRCHAVEELVINGKANTAWLEGLYDGHLQRRWTAFTEEYDPRDDLPDALRARVGERPPAATSLLTDIPGGDHAHHASHLEALTKLEQKRKYREALDYVLGLGARDASKGFRTFLASRLHDAVGEPEEALRLCEQVCQLYKDFLPGEIHHARLVRTVESPEAAIAELENRIALGEAPGMIHAELAQQLLFSGDFGRAESVVVSAIREGVPPNELADVQATLLRAVRGPRWSKSYDNKSTNYHVRSDLSQRTCADATQALEQSLAMYNRLFGRADNEQGEPARYDVYVFSGAAGYGAYARDLFGYTPRNTAGLYTPVLKQLLIWNLPSHDAMMRTIRHEGFHQYLDRLLVGDAPLWFNEGTAEYFETAALSRGRMEPGEPVGPHVARLNDKDTKWVPLEELVFMARAEFYGDAGLHYAQSWATVHFLLHSERSDRQLYFDYLEALVGGATPREAGQRVFGEADLVALDRRVKDHIKALGEGG